MRIGITGHSKLTPTSVPLVANALRVDLAQRDKPLVGVSCLARGADQLFARAVLEVGGDLAVVLPSADYRDRKVKPENRDEFENLFGQAADVRVLPYETADRDAYAAAGDAVLADVDVLVAVWDGAPPDGKGGTGDTVHQAWERGLPVTIIWPEGAARD